MIKTKTWILILGLILLLAVLAAVLLPGLHGESTTVQILQDGVCLYEIDLSAVRSPYTLTVEDPSGGSNTITVEPGRICVSHADCPDQVCVKRGWLASDPAPIVCLPHRLVIQLVGSGNLDAVVQ